MRFKLISIGLLFGFSSLQSCKTSVRSSVKDVVGAPAGFGMTFEKIPAGTFMMGSPDNEAERSPNEGPQRQVTLTKSFELQASELTQSQWVALMGVNPSNFKNEENCPGEFTTVNDIAMCPNNPVEMVSWDDIQTFIQKLNAKSDGYSYRLPTEAEWEYAARAGTLGAFAGDPDNVAWYSKNSHNSTHPAAKKKANAWGLYDMQGNVMEWTADLYVRKYASSSPVTDPLGPTSGAEDRVFRGGGADSNVKYCRFATRAGLTPGSSAPILGFRLARASIIP